MSHQRFALLLLTLLLTITTTLTAATFDPGQYGAMQWREIGPFRGGRSAAVEGIASQPNTYYFGSVGGGLWKTVDGGETWKAVSDGFFGGSIGAVAVAESDPNVVYVGGGEKTVRGNVSHGDGMWKSTDAGATWTHVGLRDSRHIPRVRIDPRNSDVVYAAVLGHLFGPNQERGVYRSRDGGRTWERILFANENAGAIDLVLDPTNPRILYASTWRVRRTPYSLESGGDGSALWKSTDGGDTWKNLSGHDYGRKGLPKGPLGIIGVSVSRSNPQNVYAIVEAEEGGVFRSRDGGETWEKSNESRDLRQRAWYYTRVYADPVDEDTVYVVNVRFHKSKDGGKTFTTIATPHGDNHDLWIAPNDPQRMVEANDGGANVTTDGGRSWTAQDNQPTAQFYRVTTDNSFPYRILGAQQDNSAVRIRHRSGDSSIGFRDWEETAGGESGHIVARPDDPDVVYGGSYGGYLTMYNHRTGEFRDLNPWPDNPMGHGAEGAAERFQWNFPLLFSPHDTNTLYAASQHLWKTTDGGASWTRISGDLTRNDTSKMGTSGGPITKDNTSVEYYGTIFAVTESPLEPGVIWAGSDDGLLHVTRDGGQTWKNITPAAPAKTTMPQWLMINSIDASPFDKGTAYVAGTAYKTDDFRPYLYKTTDYGATWTKITTGIAADHFTRVVRSDKRRKGLLYAGTERGMYVSFDDGASWQTLQLNLPIVPITDLAVRDDDLIAATQGRSFWVLDDLSPLQQMGSASVSEKSRVHLFTPRAAWRTGGSTPEKPPQGAGKNPPQGIVVNYWIDPAVKEGTKVKLAFLNRDGSVIRELEGEVKPPAPKVVAKEAKAGEEPPPTEPEKKIGVKSEGAEAEEKDPKVEKEKEKNKLPDSKPGLNRYAWNLRYPEAKKFEGLILWGGGTDGPRVVPGTYDVRLTVGDDTRTATAELKKDPRTSASQADLQAQFDYLLAANRKLTEIHEQIERMREVRKQLDDLRKRVGKDEKAKPIVDAAKALDKKMTAIEETLYQTKNRSAQDPLNFPIRLNDKLASVAESVSIGDFAPTAQHRAVYAKLVQQIDAELAKARALWTTDLPALNAMVKQSEIAAVQ